MTGVSDIHTLVVLNHREEETLNKDGVDEISSGSTVGEGGGDNGSRSVL